MAVKKIVNIVLQMINFSALLMLFITFVIFALVFMKA